MVPSGYLPPAVPMDYIDLTVESTTLGSKRKDVTSLEDEPIDQDSTKRVKEVSFLFEADPTVSIEPVQKIISQISDSPIAIRYHISFWTREKRADVVMSIWNAFGERIHEDFELLREFGESFYWLEHRSKAIEFFSKALEIRPASLQILYFRSKLFALEGRFGEAEADLNAILGADLSTASVYLAAYVHCLKKDYKTAVQYLLSAAEEIESESHLFFLLYRMIGELDNSTNPEDQKLRAMLEKIRPLSQSNSSAACSSSSSYGSKYLDEDTFFSTPRPNVIKKASSRVEPGSESLRLALQFWTRAQNSDMVDSFCLKYQESIDRDFEILYLLAVFYYEKGRSFDAHYYMDKVTALQANFLPILYLKIKLLLIDGNLDRARSELNRFVSIDLTYPALYLSALLSFHEGKYERIPTYLVAIADQIHLSPRMVDILEAAVEKIDDTMMGGTEESTYWSFIRGQIFRLIPE